MSIKSFHFDSCLVRAATVEGVQCLVASDVLRAVEYSTYRSGKRAIQRLVPERYIKRVKGGLPFGTPLNKDQLLLTEPGLYCFLLRCKMPRAEPFMKWVVETVLPGEMRALREQIEEKDMQLALLNDDLRQRDQDIAMLEDKLVDLRI